MNCAEISFIEFRLKYYGVLASYVITYFKDAILKVRDSKLKYHVFWKFCVLI